MSVATKSKRTVSKGTIRPEDLDLQFLVNFVNSDLASLNNQDPTHVLIKWFLKRHRLDSPRGLNKVQQLQQLVRDDILDVIVRERRALARKDFSPPGALKGHSDVLISLWKLTLTIELMNITTKISLGVGDGQHKWGMLNGKSFYNPAYRNIGQNRQGILRFGKEKLIVYESSSFNSSPRNQLYMIIADSLKSGDFSKLKLCRLPECGKIFIHMNSRRDFCYDIKCKDTYENREKKKSGYYLKWKEKSRPKKKPKESKVRPQYTRERAYERFEKFMKSPDLPTVKKLGNGDPSQGQTIYEGWKQLNKKLYPLNIWDKKLTAAQRGIFGSNT